MTGLYDNHNHSQFSFDGGRTSVGKTVNSAIGKGLAGVCFTDHCDFFVPPMKAKYEEYVPEVFDVEARNAEIDKVNAKCPQDFHVFKGIEIGVQKSERDKIAAHLEKYSFDEIIASVHYLDDTDPFWGGYYEGKTWRYAYGHYLETLYDEMVWLGDRFDIMGHYDYVTRYAPYPVRRLILLAVLALLSECYLMGSITGFLLSKCARYLNPHLLTNAAVRSKLNPTLSASCESEPRLMISPPSSRYLIRMFLSRTGVLPLKS